MDRQQQSQERGGIRRRRGVFGSGTRQPAASAVAQESSEEEEEPTRREMPLRRAGHPTERPGVSKVQLNMRFHEDHAAIFKQIANKLDMTNLGTLVHLIRVYLGEAEPASPADVAAIERPATEPQESAIRQQRAGRPTKRPGLSKVQLNFLLHEDNAARFKEIASELNMTKLETLLHLIRVYLGQEMAAAAPEQTPQESTPTRPTKQQRAAGRHSRESRRVQFQLFPEQERMLQGVLPEESEVPGTTSERVDYH